MEERDFTGRLIYAPTSNHQAETRKFFPGPRRARPRSDGDTGVTPPQSLQGDWVRLEGPYTVPGGRVA